MHFDFLSRISTMHHIGMAFLSMVTKKNSRKSHKTNQSTITFDDLGEQTSSPSQKVGQNAAKLLRLPSYMYTVRHQANKFCKTTKKLLEIRCRKTCFWTRASGT